MDPEKPYMLNGDWRARTVTVSQKKKSLRIATELVYKKGGVSTLTAPGSIFLFHGFCHFSPPLSLMVIGNISKRAHSVFFLLKKWGRWCQKLTWQGNTDHSLVCARLEKICLKACWVGRQERWGQGARERQRERCEEHIMSHSKEEIISRQNFSRYIISIQYCNKVNRYKKVNIKINTK